MPSGRPTWDALPRLVRTRVEAQLGARVVQHHSQSGGYSPGPTDRLVCDDGTRAFLKAAHPALNPQTPKIHRREARVLAALPAEMPVPRLLATFEESGWVVLLIEDVEGAHPPLPWRPDILERTLTALLTMSRLDTPSVRELPTAGDDISGWIGLWRELQASTDLDPWTVDRAPELLDRAERVLPHVAGDSLCHGDLRADNILVRPTGEIMIIDWPHAVRGAAWFDAALLGIEVATHHGDVDGFLRRVATGYDVDHEVLVDTLVAALGYFQWQSLQPPPPGIPTLRAFQRLQGDALVAWLRRTI